MWPRFPIVAAILGSVVLVAFVAVLVWQPWESSGTSGSSASRTPVMTLEGVVALVSREHIGCPEQAVLALTADAAYEGDGKWRVTYREYVWRVDETAGSVEPIGEPLPCPGR